MKRLHHLIGPVMGTAALIMALTAPAWAGEYVVLGNGFRLRADRHEVEGNTVRIFSGDGVVELAGDAVTGYEPEEVPAATGLPVEAKSPAAEKAAAVTEPSQALTPQDLAAQAAKKYFLPDSFVRSVMKAESGFQANAVSPKGAIGLMQLMPDTARVLGVDPKDPHQNAEGGAQYLRELLAKYENDPDQVLLALAAYNAGPGAVDHYHGVPPYRETREYILRVLKNWDQAAGNSPNK